ncbi:2-oxoacid:acceptor oxidoreductase subunit alpha [Salisediminibacterium halotolerans]|uniref:2-oxoacid:acceptor oxidoreductase subunit alpha n=1 Tax=Salisediminibacterium halotolerans TaxID=517425 RepID=UPI000EB47C3F|nr:2-oxoacid:acceptor oxidoreductase subunit alpha [Salisediminibacterium halotolerans]RLJ73133.1 2-oxoglutarate ferredoxin oxidoreductase subunit alpha [Actinophytocola xinjiangensis]RPE86555.1 2-oxoglutarate ferredoxin oxidoreductase subunit alpha [Salisediminibacterium halotolerans]TWG33930.1 2-oxoglutarate ferredoxin oxidoreductase subunit alpha [Salisediminibacterium halotolerans]GEL08854.1 2-oxoglutarate ferredoxin oxidoreductase subunit alpha [Salisediminibacterium halotolerans]
MREAVEWMVGGQQGEGVDSTGELFAKALVKHGYSVSTYKQFMSRIKGGHSNFKLNATKERNYYPGDQVDILLCLDNESLLKNEPFLAERAVVIQEGTETSVLLHQGESDYDLLTVPMKSLAKELGNAMVQNMIAIGISSALLDLPKELLHSFIRNVYGKKGDDIVRLNIDALQKGYELTDEYLPHRISPLGAAELTDQLFISGNEATGYGSLMAGCRFLSAYPITPASEIMEWLAKELPAVGGTVMQVEDEIAGICFAIGANYSGVRAMTSTSGPGLSLKTEALGMAGMSEVPIVIVNSQRGGPSTGLPTKHEQSDLQQMIYGTHGEIPRMVLYPATIEDAFYLAAESFNLAEKYQCPVIVALDLGLSMNKMTVPSFDAKRVAIDRGKLLSDKEAAAFGEEFFSRYRLTEDGISPRPKPGMEKAIHLTSSNEHSEDGYITEDPEIRTKMMTKRLEKVRHALIDEPFKLQSSDGIEPEYADVLLVGTGSTYGAIAEAMKRLNSENGETHAHLHLQQLYPLPQDQLQPLFENKRIITIENNYTGQLLNLLKQHFPIHDRSDAILQFDGNPFFVETLITKMRKAVS